MMPSNYHTHSIFCDGADHPEDMVKEAIRLGCPEIGFSGHSYTSFDPGYCMSPAVEKEYRECITELKQKYAGQIKILLGIEQDYYSDEPPVGYDYIIGGVHYVKMQGKYLPIDLSKQDFVDHIEKYYRGDPYAFIKHYYDTVAGIYAKTRCNIVAHFDLVTKFNEDGDIFDTTHPRYRAAALRALGILCATPAVFEINTGAIARGYRTTPYPDDFLISELKKRGRKLIFSSDCHNKDHLLCGYELYLGAIK